MIFTSIEIIALILIIAGIIKMFFLAINPNAWMNFAKTIWSKPRLTQIIALILAGIVFYYISRELTIIQILAVTLFVALLMAVGLADEIEYLVNKYKSIIKKRSLWKHYWLYVIIWLALLIWGLISLFN